MRKDRSVLVRVVMKQGNSALITIPRTVRERLAWNPGDAIKFDIIDGHVVLTKIELSEIQSLSWKQDGEGTKLQTTQTENK